MKARLFVAVAASLFFVMAAIPAARAQSAPEVGIKNPTTSTPTTLYMHLINFQDFPINTQKPDDKYTDNTALGLFTPTTTCFPDDIPNSHPFTEAHTYYGYSSPSYVEYNFEVDGKPRTHPERGISYDATLDANYPTFLYWYLATTPANTAAPGGVNQDQAPVVIPNVVVEATIRAGDAISVDDKAYNSGPQLAHGSTVPTTLAGPQVLSGTPPTQGSKDVTPLGQVNGQYLFQFKVPITIDTPLIPRATGYNLRIDTYMDNPYCTETGKQLMPDNVKVHTSAQYRPRMDLAVMDPIRLEYLHPQFVGDDLVVHTSMNSVWGNYDVAEVSPYTPDVGPEGIQVAITGPSPATSLAQAAVVQRTHEHYHHQEAVDVTYVWPYKTDRAMNGLYTVDVKFMNDQKTATAEGIAQFEIGKGTVIGCGGVQESAKAINNDCAAQVQQDGVVAKHKSPGFELVGVLGILGVALVLARRSKAN